MKQEKLKDLFDYLPKSKIKAGDGLEEGKYPFYTSSENQSKYRNDFQHGPGCLVFGTGGKASVHLTTGHFATSTDCITIKPKPSARIDARYVFQYFKGNMQILENGFKGAGLKHISKTYLSDIQVPHPEEVADQVLIAYLLDKVEALIAQRKQHLQQLDDLLKSVFLEMFGDSEEWPSRSLSSVAVDGKGTFSNGPFGSDLLTSELTDTGVPVIYIRDIRDARYKRVSTVCVTEEKAQALSGCLVQPGDVLIAKVGDPPGTAATYPKGEPTGVMTQDVIRLRPNTEIVNSEFVASFLNSKLGRQLIRGITVEATRARFGLREFKMQEIPVPPLDLQIQFTAIVDKIDGLKLSYQKSLADLEALYGALSQQAFKGELDLSRVTMPAPAQHVAPASIGDQATMPEPVVQTVPAIQLPDTDSLPAALEDADARKVLIEEWLEAYLGQLGHAPFSAQHFMAEAQVRLSELHPDTDFELGASDYEHIKSWVFEALAAGTLTQAFDDAGNRIHLKAAQA